MTKKVKDFIGDRVIYDKESQCVFGEKNGELQKIADIRGFGAIQNLFTRKDGSVDFDSAYEFQDKLGEFIADAILAKMITSATI